MRTFCGLPCCRGNAFFSGSVSINASSLQRDRHGRGPTAPQVELFRVMVLLLRRRTRNGAFISSTPNSSMLVSTNWESRRRSWKAMEMRSGDDTWSPRASQQRDAFEEVTRVFVREKAKGTGGESGCLRPWISGNNTKWQDASGTTTDEETSNFFLNFHFSPLWNMSSDVLKGTVCRFTSYSNICILIIWIIIDHACTQGVSEKLSQPLAFGVWTNFAKHCRTLLIPPYVQRISNICWK